MQLLTATHAEAEGAGVLRDLRALEKPAVLVVLILQMGGAEAEAQIMVLQE